MRPSYPPAGIDSMQLPKRSRNRERRRGRHREAIAARRPMTENHAPAELYFLSRTADPNTGCAVIEIQHAMAPEQDLSQPKYQEMIEFGDAIGVPVLVVRHTDDFSLWHVTPLNQSAKELLPERQTMSEQEWRLFLSVLRNLQLPPGLSDQAGVVM